MLIFCAFYLLQMIYTTLFVKCVFYLAAKCFSLPVQFSRWVWRVQLNVIWASIFLPASSHDSLNQHQHFSRLCSIPVVYSFLIIVSFGLQYFEKGVFWFYVCYVPLLIGGCEKQMCLKMPLILLFYSQLLVNIGFLECLQFFQNFLS